MTHPAAPDPTTEFLSGIKRAARHWLAFFKERPIEAETWERFGSHALRALLWCAERDGCAELATDLALTLQRPMMNLGRWQEWETLLRRVIERVRHALSPGRRWDLEAALGYLCFRLYRLEEATAIYQRQYELALAWGDIDRQNGARNALAEVYLNAEAFDLARQYAEEATTLAVVLGNPVREADALIRHYNDLISAHDI